MEHQHTPASADAQADANPPKGAVGALLQATRLRLGVELPSVAETLNIRVSYLEAIEAGNYEALPGGTYAVGFIRSYGDQLGLDGKELVRRFKLETGTQPQITPQPVNFPKPVKTLGLPIGSIITGVIVVAGLLFAGWYLLSGSDTTTLLPKLPAALNEQIDKPAPPPATQPEAPAAAAPAEAPVAPEPVQPEPPKSETPALAPAPAAPEAVKPATPAPKPEAVKPVEPPKPAAPAPKPVTEAPKPPAAEAPKPAAPVPVAEAPKPAAPAPVAEAPKPAAPPAPPPRPAVEESADSAPVGPETVARQARVYGEENAAARIELVATADAWVQVTENGSLVLTRLLHPGDRFRVPNRAGLTLMTGNAGGLDVVVDGQKAPSLGTTGQVVRDVPLNPERLRAGR